MTGEATSQCGGWTFQWRRTWADVWTPAFMSLWEAVRDADPDAHVYHRAGLVRAWADTCGDPAGAAPMIGLAHGPDGRRAILPWVIADARGRAMRRRTLGPAGDDLFGYHAPLVEGGADGVDWAAFWSAAREAVGKACDQALFRFVEPRYATGLPVETSEMAPVLDLTDVADFDTLLGRCSANHRGDVRRRFRRLEEIGTLELWIAGASDGDAARADLRDRFLFAYRDTWRPGVRPSALFRPGLEAYLDRILLEGVPGGWAHYSVLRLDGRPLAWHLGLFDRGRMYWWIPARDPAWDAYSPGKVLLARLVAHGIAARWRAIHLLTGDQAYKRAWLPQPGPLLAVRWHAPTVRGAMLGWYDRIHRAV